MPYTLGFGSGDGAPESTVETEALLVAVGNTTVYGGGMRICPDARCDDGLLDVTVIHRIPRLDMLRLLPLLAAGKRVDHPAVSRYRAATVCLGAADTPAAADGEPAGHLPAVCYAVPGALTLLLP